MAHVAVRKFCGISKRTRVCCDAAEMSGLVINSLEV